jgi:hypothetical protein
VFGRVGEALDVLQHPIGHYGRLVEAREVIVATIRTLFIFQQWKELYLCSMLGVGWIAVSWIMLSTYGGRLRTTIMRLLTISHLTACEQT